MNLADRLLRLRPPRVAAALSGLGLAAGPGLSASPLAGSSVAGTVIGLAGLAVMLRGWWLFRAADTPVCPTDCPSSLVMHDVFEVSRNPMYLAIVLMMLGLAVALVSPTLLVATLLQFLLLDRVFCPYEEQRLEQAFGEPYRDYVRRVRRWI